MALPSLARGTAVLLGTAALLLVPAAANAQGIAPPPPIDPNTPGAPTAQPAGVPQASTSDNTTARLDEAEREDTGRKFELFWVNAEVGGAYMNLTQLSSDALALEQSKSGGPMFGLGAGVRLVVFVLGARVRYNALSVFNMWQLNGEAGLKFPIKDVDFGIGGHGGYSFVGSLGDSALATNTATPTNADAVRVRGFNLGLDVTLDYFVTPTFSVGLGAFADFLFLNRPALDKPTGLSADQAAAVDADPLYQKSGTSAGLQVGGALRLGLHFGL